MEDKAAVGRDLNTAGIEADARERVQQLFDLGIGQGKAASGHGRGLCIGLMAGENIAAH